MLDLVIEGRRKDLGGGLEVGRVLPFARRRMVGPFIFLDHMGPADFSSGEGIDVRPHPFPGAATSSRRLQTQRSCAVPAASAAQQRDPSHGAAADAIDRTNQTSDVA